MRNSESRIEIKKNIKISAISRLSNKIMKYIKKGQCIIRKREIE